MTRLHIIAIVFTVAFAVPRDGNSKNHQARLGDSLLDDRAGCTDNHYRCSEWAGRGECKKNPGWMLKNCRKACKVCGTSSECKDNNSQCSGWAAKGYCEIMTCYMHKECKNACKVCGTNPGPNPNPNPNPDPGNSDKCDTTLVKIINDYRQQNGLPRVPTDETLCNVAYYHSWDLQTNRPNRGGCNLHSWTQGSKDGFSWGRCCYPSGGAACMWNKPKEFNRGFRNGNGYEISAGASFDGSGTITAQKALDMWKRSWGHNTVILNQGMWQKRPWKKMGAAIYGSYANAWFTE